MYPILKHAHSGLRWLVIAFAIYALVKAIAGLTSKKTFGKSDNLAGILFTAFVHLQFVLGLILYFLSPWFAAMQNNMAEVMKNSTARFYAVEHLTIMLLAVVLITIGRSKSKKLSIDARKHRAALIFFGIGFLLILLGIPWPFRPGLGSAVWF